MPTFLAATAVAVTLLLGLLTLVGLAVRWVLIPYLRETLIKPIAEINTQVTVNGGTSDQPTVLDRIERVHQAVNDAREEASAARENSEEARAELIALARMFDGHLEWSQEEVDRLTKAIKLAHEKLGLEPQ